MYNVGCVWNILVAIFQPNHKQHKFKSIKQSSYLYQIYIMLAVWKVLVAIFQGNHNKHVLKSTKKLDSNTFSRKTNQVYLTLAVENISYHFQNESHV